jgi:hypothetical protein
MAAPMKAPRATAATRAAQAILQTRYGINAWA